jgi:hypothetical protein
MSLSSYCSHVPSTASVNHIKAVIGFPIGEALSILTVEDVVGSPVVIAEVMTLAVVVVVVVTIDVVVKLLVNVTVKVLVDAGMVVFNFVVIVLVQPIVLTTKIINMIPMPKYFFKSGSRPPF